MGKPRRRHSRNVAWFMQHCAQYTIVIKAAVRASVFLHISTASVMTIPDHIRIAWRQSSVVSRVQSSLEQSRAASSLEPRAANRHKYSFFLMYIKVKVKVLFLQENHRMFLKISDLFGEWTTTYKEVQIKHFSVKIY